MLNFCLRKSAAPIRGGKTVVQTDTTIRASHHLLFEGPTVALKAEVIEATYADHLSEALDLSSTPFLKTYVLRLR
jgi:hypothetical protein